jgi:hypothetical protein
MMAGYARTDVIVSYGMPEAVPKEIGASLIRIRFYWPVLWKNCIRRQFDLLRTTEIQVFLRHDIGLVRGMETDEHRKGFTATELAQNIAGFVSGRDIEISVMLFRRSFGTEVIPSILISETASQLYVGVIGAGMYQMRLPR